MGLYEAMESMVAGAVPNLYLLRLPDVPTNSPGPDAAYIPIPGTGATRAFGSETLQPADSVDFFSPEGDDPHDGGILWYHSGVQFQIRAAGNSDNQILETVKAADDIRDALAQFAGTPIDLLGERIIRCEIVSSPTFYEQDEKGRPIMSLTVEVWHKPIRS